MNNIILQADRGVKIYIIHWKESKFAVTFNSALSKSYFKEVHEGIKMLRHPRTLITMWSHHAKLVIIDQSIAFVGGLDICYGRWDTPAHRLLDISNDPNEPQLFPGNDYSNEKLRMQLNTEDHTYDTLDRNTEVRMPWHDVSVCFEGESASDFGRHFV